MSDTKDFRINYVIDVQTSDSVATIDAFAKSIGKITEARTRLDKAVSNIKDMMDEIDKAFRTKGGKKRDYSYNINIETNKTEEKLQRVVDLLDTINAKTKDIKLVINAGEKLDSKAIAAQAKAVINHQKNQIDKTAQTTTKKNAAQVGKEVVTPLTRIESIVGKVNAALISLEKKREIHIDTTVAKQRLQDILSLLQQIKGASKMTLGAGMVGPPGKGNGGTNSHASAILITDPGVASKVFNTTGNRSDDQLRRQALNREKQNNWILSKAYQNKKKEDNQILKETFAEQENEYRFRYKQKLDAFNKSYREGIEQTKLYDKAKEMTFANQMKGEAEKKKNYQQFVTKAFAEKEKKEQQILKETFAQQENEYRHRYKQKLAAFNKSYREGIEQERLYDKAKEMTFRNTLKREKELDKQSEKRRRTADQEIKRQRNVQNAIYGDTRRAAINRLQYNRGFTWRNLPLVGMMNAYMAYGAIRSQLSQAIDYSNTMESARSILKVGDGDIATFENRFQRMATLVRQIGVETKFTANEVAGATRYLAMAGLNIEDISKAMRPITNLAIIGDNDLAQVADLTTNIMSGYNIYSGSMNSVADIIAATTSRSNVNIIEMAEAFKMASGHMKLSGIEFSEAAAAIGILGNSGMKGTLAGTALRAMAVRFINPTKQSAEVLERLGVKVSEFQEIAGKRVEKLRPLVEIFEDLHTKGATLQDMIKVFGKVGGTGAMHMISNYEQLKELTLGNKYSYGISEKLAEVKQNTVKGLWAQLTSQLTEGFMRSYENVEPIIRSVLRDLLSRINTKEFVNGLTAIVQSFINLFAALSKIGIWIANNYRWIEPLFVTGFIAKKIIGLAAAFTNLGVAVGFLGKQKLGAQAIGAIVGVADVAAIGKKGTSLLSQGHGFMTPKTRAANQGIRTLLGTQIATGGGLLGSVASLGMLGWGVTAAVSAFGLLAGAVGYAAYRTYQLKQAKDALLEDINQRDKYRFKSVEDLSSSLREAYNLAMMTKSAVADLAPKETLEENTKHDFGNFLFGNFFTEGAKKRRHYNMLFNWGVRTSVPQYDKEDIYSLNLHDALIDRAREDGITIKQKALNDLSKITTYEGILAFEENLHSLYGHKEELIDKSLFYNKVLKDTDGNEVKDQDGNVVTYYFYDESKKIEKQPYTIAFKTPSFADHINKDVLPAVNVFSTLYKKAMASPESALSFMVEHNFPLADFRKRGFTQDKDGNWIMPQLPKNYTPEQLIEHEKNMLLISGSIEGITKAITSKFDYNPIFADNILKLAGWKNFIGSNEPKRNANDLSELMNLGLDGVPDDLKSGGNYGGAGKVQSSAPKQVIVNIQNLMSIQSIDLMKSPEGQKSEIQDLKETLAQALIDVVHEFDASWHG